MKAAAAQPGGAQGTVKSATAPPAGATKQAAGSRPASQSPVTNTAVIDAPAAPAVPGKYAHANPFALLNDDEAGDSPGSGGRGDKAAGLYDLLDDDQQGFDYGVSKRKAVIKRHRQPACQPQRMSLGVGTPVPKPKPRPAAAAPAAAMGTAAAAKGSKQSRKMAAAGLAGRPADDATRQRLEDGSFTLSRPHTRALALMKQSKLKPAAAPAAIPAPSPALVEQAQNFWSTAPLVPDISSPSAEDTAAWHQQHQQAATQFKAALESLMEEAAPPPAAAPFAAAALDMSNILEQPMVFSQSTHNAQ